METQVLIAHTGQRLQIDASQLSSYGPRWYPSVEGLSLY